MDAVRRLIQTAFTRLLRRPNTTLLVLDHQGQYVPGAQVQIAGVGTYVADKQGTARLQLSDDIYHSLTILFENHEEVLYIERLAQGQNYIYRPDKEVTTGRAFVLSRSNLVEVRSTIDG